MRFEFGRNWQAFAANALSEDRIRSARRDFHRLLSPEELQGRTFCDIGFGQGLALHLAAEAGAIVHGMDIDPDNLSALEARASFFPTCARPEVKIGSILDSALIDAERSNGPFDIVHSWGVLHHTGAMYSAIDNCIALLKPSGKLVISIYNSHWSSPFWRLIKQTYNKSPRGLQELLIWLFYPLIFLAKLLVTQSNPLSKERGMDFYYDVIDWIGGYPYEHASAETIKNYVETMGLKQIKFFPPQVPTGCNEFVFIKLPRS